MCGNCLEMPEIWQETRICNFRYDFFTYVSDAAG